MSRWSIWQPHTHKERAVKAQAYLIPIERPLQDAYSHNPEAKAAKWNPATITSIIQTCVPLMWNKPVDVKTFHSKPQMPKCLRLWSRGSSFGGCECLQCNFWDISFNVGATNRPNNMALPSLEPCQELGFKWLSFFLNFFLVFDLLTPQ